MSSATIDYVLQDKIELNFAYMPFIKDGGIFILTNDNYSLGDEVSVNLQLPGEVENLLIEGKVIWITPKHALHHALSGIGIQFTGSGSHLVRKFIENHLDPAVEVGGYIYGLEEKMKKGGNSIKS